MSMKTFKPLWWIIVVIVLPSYISPANTTNNRTATQEICQHMPDHPMSFFAVVLICVFVIGLMGNGLAVIVIFLSRSLRKQSTNLFVASLNLCDIGVILCIVPLRINEALYDDFCFGIHVCRYFNLSDSLFHVSSISHLFVMAIERYVAVRVPFVYHRQFNRTMTIKIICATWMYSVLWTLASVIKWSSPITASTHINFFIHRRYCVCLLYTSPSPRDS